MADNDFLDFFAAPFGGADGIDRRNLNTKIEQLGEYIGTERDAPYVTDPDVFDGMSREEMLGNVGNLSSQAIAALSDGYMDVASEFGLAWALLSLRNITGGEQWTGQAADAANGAIEKLSKPVSDTHASFQTIGLKMRQASSAAGDVRPKVESLLSNAEALPLLLSGADAADLKEKREQERREAARILESIYKPTFVDAGTNVPSIMPPETINGVGGPGVGTGSGSGSAGSAGATGSIGAAPYGFAPGEPGAGESPDAAAGTQAATAAPTDQGTNGAAASTAPVGANTPAATSSASALQHGAAGASALGGTAHGSTSGGGGASGFGSGAVGGGAVGSGGFGGAGSNGRAIFTGPVQPGAAPGAGAAATGAAAGGSTARPGSARPPMGMPMAGRGAGAGQDDTEHQTPSYLINVENGNELIGDLAPVAPPVIGE